VTPEGLSVEAAALWEAVTRDYLLSTPEEHLLTEACHALTRAHEARVLLAADGLLIDGKPNPMLKVEHDSQSRFARLLRELGLAEDLELPRPPRIEGRYLDDHTSKAERRRRAAQAEVS
jgi:phage terminase small subunit